MSYLHIRVIKKIEIEDKIVFEIQSPDFNERREWENLGNLQIDIKSQTFSHLNDELWVQRKILPISICQYKPSERKQLVQNKYQGFAGGSWAQKLYNFVETCLSRNEYPDIKEIIA